MEARPEKTMAQAGAETGPRTKKVPPVARAEMVPQVARAETVPQVAL